MKKSLYIVTALILFFGLFAGCAGTSGGGDIAAATPPPANANTPPPANPAVPPPPEQKEGWDFSGAPEVNLIFVIFMPEFDPMTVYACRYLDTIKEYTEGTVDYTLYAGQSLCAGDEQLDAVNSGLADVAFCNTANHAGAMPVTNTLEYPGVPYANNVAASYAMQEWHDILQLEELRDFHLLFACGQGNGMFITTVPLRTVEDFKGVQMRTSAVLIPILQTYGFIPTAMVIAEAYEALRTGVVQGATCQVPAGYTFKFHEICKYVTLDPYFISSYVMVLNKDIWDSLTPDQQEAVQAASDVAYAEFIAPGREAEVPAVLDEFTAAGVEVIELNAENKIKMGELVSPLQAAYAAGVPGGTDALALIHELAAKYNAIYPG